MDTEISRRAGDTKHSLLLEVALIVILFFSPLFFGLVREWMLMVVLAFIFLLAIFFPDAVFGIKKLSPLIRTVGVILSGLIFFQSFFTSLCRYETHSELLKWLAFSLVFLLIQLLEPSSIHHLFLVLAILGLAEASYGLWELWLGAGKVLWKGKEAYQAFVTGTYINRNHCAGLLELCLGLQLGFFLKAFAARRFFISLAFFLGILATLVGFFQTGSRMGLASFILSLVILSPFLARRSKKIFGLFIFGMISMMGILFFFAGRTVFDLRWKELSEYVRWEGGRFLVWKDTFQILRDYPWFGTGLGTFRWIFPHYQSQNLLMKWSHAHNDYLELAVTLGIPGFLALLGFFLVLFLNFYSGLNRLRDSLFLIIWGALVSMVSLTLHGLADFNFAIPANSLLFLVVVAGVFRLMNYSP